MFKEIDDYVVKTHVNKRDKISCIDIFNPDGILLKRISRRTLRRIELAHEKEVAQKSEK